MCVWPTISIHPELLRSCVLLSSPMMHLDNDVDRGHRGQTERQLESMSACYIWLFVCATRVCLCEFKCLYIHFPQSSHVCACVRACAVVMVQSGRSILQTLSSRIDFLLPDPWKHSCNTADPPSCVTLSFWDADQSEDELEIATHGDLDLRGGGRGAGGDGSSATHTGSCMHSLYLMT